jgi:hypothetical protein
MLSTPIGRVSVWLTYSSRATTIVDFLAELSKKHGSVEDYVQDILQFSRIEIETINRNLHSKELK